VTVANVPAVIALTGAAFAGATDNNPIPRAIVVTNEIRFLNALMDMWFPLLHVRYENLYTPVVNAEEVSYCPQGFSHPPVITSR
jgi:hypothetical protein